MTFQHFGGRPLDAKDLEEVAEANAEIQAKIKAVSDGKERALLQKMLKLHAGIGACLVQFEADVAKGPVLSGEESRAALINTSVLGGLIRRLAKTVDDGFFSEDLKEAARATEEANEALRKRHLAGRGPTGRPPEDHKGPHWPGCGHT